MHITPAVELAQLVAVMGLVSSLAVKKTVRSSTTPLESADSGSSLPSVRLAQLVATSALSSPLGVVSKSSLSKREAPTPTHVLPPGITRQNREGGLSTLPHLYPGSVNLSLSPSCEPSTMATLSKPALPTEGEAGPSQRWEDRFLLFKVLEPYLVFGQSPHPLDGLEGSLRE